MFHHPVSTSTEGCQQYYQIIKKPIDLETMEKKNARGEYKSVAAFHKDMSLLFANCYKYNKVKMGGVLTRRMRLFRSMHGVWRSII